MIGAAFLSPTLAWFNPPDTSEAVNLDYDAFAAVAEEVIQEWQEEAGLEFAHWLGLLEREELKEEARQLADIYQSSERDAETHRKVKRKRHLAAEGLGHYFSCKALSVPPGSILLWALILCKMVGCASRLTFEV